MTPLCYCGNVHPAADLDELLQSLASGPALVREELGLDRMGYGLWLSLDALRASAAEGHRRLRGALDEHRLEVWTLNGFPVGNFHAPVVKHDVYRPNWAEDERLSYTLLAAELLVELLPDQVEFGSISTLPVGYARDFENPARKHRALQQLRKAARELSKLGDRRGKRVRLCLEPEPGCVLETGADAVALFEELLRSDPEAVTEHLGVCLDACHHAVAFEDPKELLFTILDAGIAVGKVQLSSAVDLGPDDPEARTALRALDEPRFLHQVRARSAEGFVTGCDDIGQAAALQGAERWRVHYHLPIHKSQYGALNTTQSFLLELMRLFPKTTYDTHFEVETYTWGVLPEDLRPGSDNELARCIADELRFAEEQLR